MNTDNLIKSKNKNNLERCKKSIDLIEEKAPEFLYLLEDIEKILIDKYEKGDALAATFADEKIIVLTIPDDIDIEFLASILIHESTHINHYKMNPSEYATNQIKAEQLAFKNEMNFLKRIDRDDLVEEAKKVRDNLLNFLEKNSTTTDKEENLLKKEDINMTKHQVILNEYLNE